MNIVLSHHDLPLHIYADGKEIHNGGQRLISCRLLGTGYSFLSGSAAACSGGVLWTLLINIRLVDSKT